MMKNEVLWGYLKRYTIVHVLVYLIVGLISMSLMNYKEGFMSDDYFAHFRPLDSPIVRAALLFQVVRGLMIALIIYPFRDKIVGSKHGWLMLFFVLFGLTCIGAINAPPGSIEGFIYTNVSLKAHLIGMPEIIVQSIGISALFYWWEKRNYSHK
ncbi:hypothetical protein RI065_10945 [Mycoplasmatota bacterium zrk1]